jgi:hypothetical protein
MRPTLGLPPTSVEALATGAPPIHVLLLDLGQALAIRLTRRPGNDSPV